MSSILSGELAEAVTGALEAERVPDALSVTRTIPGTYDPGTGTTGPDTVTVHACRGWVESYDDDTIDGTRINASDVRVMVLTTSIDVEPSDDTDTITVNGEVLSILSVKHDASGALFIVQARA